MFATSLRSDERSSMIFLFFFVFVQYYLCAKVTHMYRLLWGSPHRVSLCCNYNQDSLQFNIFVFMCIIPVV